MSTPIHPTFPTHILGMTIPTTTSVAQPHQQKVLTLGHFEVPSASLFSPPPSAVAHSNKHTTTTTSLLKGAPSSASANSTPFPTPQVSPSSSLNISKQLTATRQQQVSPPPFTVTLLAPSAASPTCSVATQTAELLAWTEDQTTVTANSENKEEELEATSRSNVLLTEEQEYADLLESGKGVAPANGPSAGTAPSADVDDEFDELTLQGTAAVIMSLVLKGDQHWETTNPRRCKTAGAKTNIQHTITGLVSALRAGGLLRDEVAITMVVYLRRLSAHHVKYVSRFTIKKYLVAACMVANKTCSDQYYCLADYEQVTGQGKAAIVQGEIQFLTNLDYDVQTGILDHDQPVGFYQTSVLIHDMAVAAAAVVQTQQQQQQQHSLTAPNDEATATTLEEDAAVQSQDLQLKDASGPTGNIASVVEGILAQAEALM